MRLDDYLSQGRIKRLRKRSHLEAFRVEAAESLGSDLGRIEEIRLDLAGWLGITPEAFDALLVRFYKSRELCSIYAELSQGKMPAELEEIILNLPTLSPAERQLRVDSVARRVPELPPVLLDAVIRDTYRTRVYERIAFGIALGNSRNSQLVPWAALILVLLLVGVFLIGRASSPAQPSQLLQQREVSSDFGRGENLAITHDLAEAHSELRSAFWLHLLSVGLLLAGLVLIVTAKRHSKLQIAGVAVSLLSGLSLFPLKEFHVFDKLTDKIEIDLPSRTRTPNIAIPGFEMERTCIVETFPEAMADVDDPGVRPSLKKCSDTIAVRSAGGWSIAFMFLVGHADKRNLRPSQRPKLANNEALAFLRASAVKGYLLKTLGPSTPGLDERIIVTSSGAANVGVNTTSDDLAKDRSVNVYAYWIRTGSMP